MPLRSLIDADPNVWEFGDQVTNPPPTPTSLEKKYIRRELWHSVAYKLRLYSRSKRQVVLITLLVFNCVCGRGRSVKGCRYPQFPPAPRFAPCAGINILWLDTDRCHP